MSKVEEDINWDIQFIIMDCLTNPVKPDFPDNFYLEEYNSRTHGTKEEMPLPAKHLAIEEAKHLFAIQDLDEQISRHPLNSPESRVSEKLRLLVKNHLDTIIDLQMNLIYEALALKGIDSENLQIVILADWMFTYVNVSEPNFQNQPKTESETRILH